jgi:hypothetical protein
LVTSDITGWEAESTVILGGLGAGEDEVVFGAAMVAEDTLGRFVVLNAGDGRVAAYDSTGSFLGTIGHVGEGPGAYAAATGLAIEGDYVYILDSGAGRISAFSIGDFAFARSVSTGMAYGVPMKISPAGSNAMYVAFEPMPGIGEGNDLVLTRLDLRSGQQHVVERLAKPEAILVQTTGEGQRTVRMVNPPFAPKPSWSVDATGHLLVGDGSAMLVTAVMDEGLHVVVNDREAKATPVTAVERKAYLEANPNIADAGELRFPDHQPYFTDVEAGPGGTIWLRTPLDSTEVWTVYSRTGLRLGRVSLQPRARIAAIEKSSLYIVTYDELDVETLHLAKVRRSGR